MLQVSQHVRRIRVLAYAVVTPMHIAKERPKLTERQRCLPCPLTRAGVQPATGIDGRKGLAEIVNITEASDQWVQRGSWMMRG
jgi:hypothetical protein